jgi:transcription-repair coupling factor (superfamily II helicase)
MPAVHGLYSLLRLAHENLSLGKKTQVSGGSLALNQLFLLGGVARDFARHIVIVVPHSKDVSVWSRFIDSTISSLPGERGIRGVVLPYVTLYGADRFVNPALNRRQRLHALSALLESTETIILVTTLQGLAQTTLTKESFQAATVSLSKGMELDQDSFITGVEDLGYTLAASVAEEGQFSVRGGIVDIFPVNQTLPLRLEWTFDRISSLRLFHAADQRSAKAVEKATIVPAFDALTIRSTLKDDAQRLFNVLLEKNIHPSDRDGMVSQFQLGLKFSGFDMFAPLFRPGAKTATAIDYLDPNALFVFPGSESAVFTRYQEHCANLEVACVRDEENGRPTLSVADHFLPMGHARDLLLRSLRRVEFGNPFSAEGVDLCRIEGRVTVEGAPTVSSQGADIFEKWLEIITALQKNQDASIVILTHYDDRFDRIEKLFKHRSVEIKRDTLVLEKFSLEKLVPGCIYLGCGDVAGHIWLQDPGILVISEEALFGVRPRTQRGASQKLKNYLSSFADLKVGDLVVHVQHGIGRYLGLTSLAIAEIASDFLIVEYAGNDKIYLPVDRLSLLQRYSVGGDGVGPASHPLDRLGGGFEKRKSRVQTAVRDMAEELIKIQARRSVAKGMSFSPPDDTYLQFEAAFPYEETEDQLRALQDTEADLLSGKPMDRLVCGDVGFGKTEVALRAAMRTVLEGHQVLVLVPTTVLCFQHFRTFQERLGPFGVKVAQVNRFVKPAGIKEALHGLEKGTVDILVGTHRLLSHDVKPKRLGLLVVDEEQRFGVSHKERLKTLRSSAHILTLTATPIPRTLHMAMLGLRDISIIATPPQDRMAVKTYIAPFDESLVKEAIHQEVRRGGQVFFVHNRIEDIEEMRIFIASLIPGIEVRVGHGQMPEHRLERVIVDFLEGRFQVLLCTTIIESGIDMPHVNTLIVNRADRFGLAQLYQLRGRVGRSNVQAYAYFLTPPVEQVAEDAKKRLDVLAAHQELGAGFQIASYDLELRGAGHLLGDAQSGHASEVGLELYTDLLDEAIQEMRGERHKERIDTEIRIPVSAMIPGSYIQAEAQRLHLYKRLFGTQSDIEIDSIRQEMLDRFGALPDQCLLLLKVARLKQSLSQIGAIRLSAGKSGFELRFGEVSIAQADRLMRVVAMRSEKYRIAPDNRLILSVSIPERPSFALQDLMLNQLAELIDPLVS